MLPVRTLKSLARVAVNTSIPRKCLLSLLKNKLPVCLWELLYVNWFDDNFSQWPKLAPNVTLEDVDLRDLLCKDERLSDDEINVLLGPDSGWMEVISEGNETMCVHSKYFKMYEEKMCEVCKDEEVKQNVNNISYQEPAPHSLPYGHQILSTALIVYNVHTREDWCRNCCKKILFKAMTTKKCASTFWLSTYD